MREQQGVRPPKQILTCTLCNMVFYKPITLPCGHTFCRQCMQHQTRVRSNSNSEMGLHEEGEQNEMKTGYRKNLSVCSICDSIIWKGLPQIKENLAIQNMVAKFYISEINKRRKSVSSQVPNEQVPMNREGNSQYYNKILIRIRQPSVMPSPCCYSNIEFSTCFIDEIIGQSQQIVITWRGIEQKNIGLLCKMTKVEPIQSNSIYDRVVFNVGQSDSALELAYRANILGIYFVKLETRELISINLRHKLIILGQEQVDKIMKNLQICNCSIFHSTNSKNIQPQTFNIFFTFYDSMNNPHYIRQIHTLISDEPFQTRTNTELMLYCVLRLLKLGDEEYNKLVLCFDDMERIMYVNNWLIAHRNKMIDQILRVKIPGKYNSGVVFFMIFILLAFNLFQDYAGRIL